MAKQKTTKWTRIDTGAYTALNGQLKVCAQNDSRKWDVFVCRDGVDLEPREGSSYKEAKQLAEALLQAEACLSGGEAEQPGPEASVPKRQRQGQDSEPFEFEGRGPVSLDSALRSVALAANQLASALDHFTATYRAKQ